MSGQPPPPPSGASPGDEGPEAAAAPAGTARRRPQRDDPVLPDRAAEDRPEAWGERADEDDDERYLRDRPPHW
ncbi:hypothetical protein [uncultured Pseudokineococcus sp.]|uniref:hypothetical protein n=1 Tax=uncultured Pseudokineococcus sp. TaxID=1642928 RepID=UPI00260C8E86|nr:hypothetical protein [uncultured Pseudokineococcus sp.]